MAASKELRNAIKDLSWKEIETYGVKHGVEWEFSAAAPPGTMVLQNLWLNLLKEPLILPLEKK